MCYHLWFIQHFLPFFLSISVFSITQVDGKTGWKMNNINDPGTGTEKNYYYLMLFKKKKYLRWDWKVRAPNKESCKGFLKVDSLFCCFKSQWFKLFSSSVEPKDWNQRAQHTSIIKCLLLNI